MITHLLDTSIYSQPLRRQPHAAAVARWSRLGDARCATSRVCLAEVEAGLRAEQRTARLAKFQRLLLPRLPVLPADDGVWQTYADLKAHQLRRGLPVPDFDLLIAATAQRHHLILATLNVRNFSLIESLRVEDWSAP